MAAVEDINRAFRDHVRYTGDGLPNEPDGAPLPVGDPSSGGYNVHKADIRDAMLTLLMAGGNPEALQDILQDLETKASKEDVAAKAGKDELAAAEDQIILVDRKADTLTRPDFLPLTRFDDPGVVAQVDATGRPVGGPVAAKDLQRQINDKPEYLALPLSSFGDAGTVAQVDAAGNRTGGPQVMLDLNKRLLAIESGGSQGAGEDDYAPVTLDALLITNGRLYRRTDAGAEVLVMNPAPRSFVGVPRWVGRSILARLDRPGTTATTAVVVDPEGRMMAPSPYGVLNIVAGYGQSNMTGERHTGPVFTDAVRHPAMLMFAQDGGDSVRIPTTTEGLMGFAALRSTVSADGKLGATSLEGFANRLGVDLRDRLGIAPRWLFFTAARGGRKLTELAKGTTPYNLFMEALETAVELAEAEDRDAVLRTVIFTQGEADSGNTAWKAGMVQLHADMQADIQAITGQASGIRILLQQPVTFGATVNVLAQLALAEEHPDKFVLTHTPYNLPYCTAAQDPDLPLLHLTSEGNLLKGEYEYKAMLQGEFGPGVWTGCRPKAITYDATARTVDIECHVPRPPLVIDPAWPSYGTGSITVTDGSGDVPFTLSLLNPTTLRLTLGRAPTGTRTVAYATRSYSYDSNGVRVAGTGPCGPIHDSETMVSAVDGRALVNPLAIFQKTF